MYSMPALAEMSLYLLVEQIYADAPQLKSNATGQRLANNSGTKL